MNCPLCHHHDTKVTNSRLKNDGFSIRRRRECLMCGHRFSTIEELKLLNLIVVKNNNIKESYDKNKLIEGIKKSCEKRPVSEDDIDKCVCRIEQAINKVQKISDRENDSHIITSKSIGLLVLNELKNLDQVAYIRYASVFRNFKDINELTKEINKLN